MPAKILYIEDNPFNMRLVRKLLQMDGYEMLEANNGTTGLEIIENEHPDLVLLDINLPDIDGVEVVGRLKADPEYAHIPVVALTANAMYGDRERFVEAGCDGYIAKPVSKRELLTTVSMFLEASKNPVK